MHLEPLVILEVDRRLAQFIRSAHLPTTTRATPQDIGRWQAAQEVRSILREACPYELPSPARTAWFQEKYGDTADAVMGD